MPDTPQNDEQKVQEILRHIEEELRQKLRLGGLTLDEIEEQSQVIGEQVKRIIEEESLHSQGNGYGGRHLACPRGHRRARYTGMRSRAIITVSGIRTLRRAYYHCSECRSGWCPTDQALEIGRGECSRRVQALIARFSSYLPYRTAAKEMEAVCGIRLAASTVSRYAQALGERLRQEWEQMEKVREAENLPPSDLPLPHRPARLHVTMDGVMAHVEGDWHEVKLGCVYQTSAEGKARLSRYMATLSPSVIFGKRLRVLAHRAGGDRCRDVAVVPGCRGGGGRSGVDMAGDRQAFPKECTSSGLLPCNPASVGTGCSPLWRRRTRRGRMDGSAEGTASGRPNCASYHRCRCLACAEGLRPRVAAAASELFKPPSRADALPEFSEGWLPHWQWGSGVWV